MSVSVTSRPDRWALPVFIAAVGLLLALALTVRVREAQLLMILAFAQGVTLGGLFLWQLAVVVRIFVDYLDGTWFSGALVARYLRLAQLQLGVLALSLVSFVPGGVQVNASLLTAGLVVLFWTWSRVTLVGCRLEGSGAHPLPEVQEVPEIPTPPRSREPRPTAAPADWPEGTGMALFVVVLGLAGTVVLVYAAS